MPKHCPSCARIESDGEYCPSCNTKLVNPDAIPSSNYKDAINSDYWVISGRIWHISEEYSEYSTRHRSNNTISLKKSYTFRVNNTDIVWDFNDLPARNGDYVNVLLHKSCGAIALYNARTDVCPRARSNTSTILYFGGSASVPFLCCFTGEKEGIMIGLVIILVIIGVMLYYYRKEKAHQKVMSEFCRNKGKL